MYDTYMLAKSTGGAMVKAGGDSWFFVTADYAFGHALEREVGEFVKNAGGRVMGSVRTPFPGTTDFSSFLIQAQSSGAKVLGLANAGFNQFSDLERCALRPGTVHSAGSLSALLALVIARYRGRVKRRYFRADAAFANPDVYELQEHDASNASDQAAEA